MKYVRKWPFSYQGSPVGHCLALFYFRLRFLDFSLHMDSCLVPIGNEYQLQSRNIESVWPTVKQVFIYLE